MKPAPFDYVAPASLDEACRILAEAGGGAQVIAGGQTLMPLLALRMSQPFILVDVNGVPELGGVEQTASGLRIGAALRQRDVLENGMVARSLPALARALSHVGHHQTRNRGTLGGSLALGEPAAEMPAAAVALDATMELRSLRGQRLVPAREFYLGPYMTAMEPDEVLVAAHYPRWPDGHRPVFRELARRPGDFALVGLVGALALENGRIARAGLTWFGMGPRPIPARHAESALIGAEPAGLDLAALADLALSETAPFDDVHTSAEYRRTVGRHLFRRALREALEEAA